MASETLEEKKSEEEASPVEGTDDSKVEEQPQDANKDEEKENKEVPEKVASNEDKEIQVPEEIDVEDKHDEEEVAKPEGEEKREEEDEEVDKEEKEEEHHEEDGKEEENEETPDKTKRDGLEKQSKESVDEKEKEPVTPSGDRPTRERKVVERYSIQQTGRSATKPVSIEKGRGTQLKDIPNVAFKLSKRKPDDNLQMLHTILFGKKGKAHNLKKNIGQFSGYVWAENEEKQKAKTREKIDKCVKEKLVDFCDVLNIPINKAATRKEELTVKLLEFLESPHATTDVLLADKKQKGKKRKATPGKSASPGEDSATPAKKRKWAPQSGEKRKRSPKVDMDEDEDKDDSPETKDTKDDSEDVNDESDVQKEESDQEESKSEEEEDEPKEQPSTKKASKKNLKETSGTKNMEKVTPAKKGTHAKSVKAPTKSSKKSSDSSLKEDAEGNSQSKGSMKKPKIGKESPKEKTTTNKEMGSGKKQSSKLPSKASAKEQGRAKSSKKAKAEPTRKDMHAVVVDILKEVDFNTATFSDILRQLGTHFGVDLMHRKAEVKDIITEVINNMSDEEDDGEEVEDNADVGNDADKDGDGDA